MLKTINDRVLLNNRHIYDIVTFTLNLAFIRARLGVAPLNYPEIFLAFYVKLSLSTNYLPDWLNGVDLKQKQSGI